MPELSRLGHSAMSARCPVRRKAEAVDTGIIGQSASGKSYAEARPEVVALARELSNQRMSLRKNISRACPSRPPHRQRSAIRRHGRTDDACRTPA